jgi:hypothetical protein
MRPPRLRGYRRFLDCDGRVVATAPLLDRTPRWRRKVQLWWHKTEIYIALGGILLVAFLCGVLVAKLTNY